MNHPSPKLGLPPDLQPLSKGSKMRRMFTGLAMASLMILGMYSVANAQGVQTQFSCIEGGNPPPASNSSSVTVTSQSGPCTLGSVEANGEFIIDVKGGGTLTAGDLTSQTGDVEIAMEGSSGAVSVGSISAHLAAFTLQSTGNFTASGAIAGPSYVNISGQATISITGAVTSSAGYVALAGSSINVTGAVSGASPLTETYAVSLAAATSISTGDVTGPVVYISAYDSGAAGNLTIGGGGVNSITSNSATGGNVTVKNGFQASGTTSGPNNITVSALSDLTIGHSASGGGYLYMLATGGNIKLPSGSLVVDGHTPTLWLQGKTLTTTGATTLSTNAPAGADSKHELRLDFDTFAYSGNLTLLSNGNGQSSLDGFVYIGSYSSYYALGTSQIQFNGTANAALDLESNGNYDYSQIAAGTLGFNTGGAVTLRSQGVTDHQVFLNGKTPVSLTINTTGAFLLDASGTAGPGGIITVNVGTATINSPTFTLNANGPATGDGAGGTISYTAVATSLLGSATKGLLTANAAAAGSGAASTSAITFHPGSSIAIGLGADQFAFSANGGATSGNAGTIAVNAMPGGIRVNVPAVAPMVVISAIAPGSSGIGGNVSIANNLSQFDINGGIKVDASPSAAVGVVDGTITLNSVLCQQYKTGSSSWPLTYWDCTGATPDKIQEGFATNSLMITNPTTLIGSLQTLLGNKVTSMYTLSSLANYNSVFEPSSPISDAAGATLVINPTAPNGIYTTIFTGSGPNTSQKEEAVGHEFGHAIDVANSSGGVRPSDGANYENYAISDYLNLDYSAIGATEKLSTYRNPCVAGAQPAPLAGVINESVTGFPQFCSGGVLQDPNGVGYAHMTNSAILNSVDLHIFSLDALGGFVELYAQIFTYKDFAYANVGTTANLYDPTADLLFFNNYMYCTGKWALAVAQGQAVPPSSAPAYCIEGDSMTGWAYQPFKSKTH